MNVLENDNDLATSARDALVPLPCKLRNEAVLSAMKAFLYPVRWAKDFLLQHDRFELAKPVFL